jgi:hypothetical protein
MNSLEEHVTYLLTVTGMTVHINYMVLAGPSACLHSHSYESTTSIRMKSTRMVTVDNKASKIIMEVIKASEISSTLHFQASHL